MLICCVLNDFSCCCFAFVVVCVESFFDTEEKERLGEVNFWFWKLVVAIVLGNIVVGKNE